MSRGRWLASVPASLALHGAGLLLVLWLLPQDTLPPVIVLGLSEVAVGDPAVASSPRPQVSAKAGRGDDRLAEVAAPPRSASLAPAPTPPPNPQTESESPERTHVAAFVGPDDPLPDRQSFKGKLDRSDSQPMATAAGDALSGSGRSDNLSGLGTLWEWGGGEGPHSKLVQSGKGQNQGLVLAVPGAGQGGLGAEYGSYLARIRQRIQESLEYPLAARRRGLTGTVHMEIVIQPTGAIGPVSLLRSSSHRILDEAAVDTIQRLPPLPFPAELPPRTLRVRLPVVFELR